MQRQPDGDAGCAQPQDGTRYRHVRARITQGRLAASLRQPHAALDHALGRAAAVGLTPCQPNTIIFFRHRSHRTAVDWPTVPLMDTDNRVGHGMETIVVAWLEGGRCALICACGQSQRLTHKPRTWTHFDFIWRSEERFWIRCRACHAHIERCVSYASHPTSNRRHNRSHGDGSGAIRLSSS